MFSKSFSLYILLEGVRIINHTGINNLSCLFFIYLPPFSLDRDGGKYY